MSRPRVVPISCRFRQVMTPDIWAPPPNDAEHAANVRRVNTRLNQGVAAKASASNVAAKRQEVPRVPRVARQPRQHASTLESKESSLKGMCHSHPPFTPTHPSLPSTLHSHPTFISIHPSLPSTIHSHPPFTPIHHSLPSTIHSHPTSSSWVPPR